MKYLATILALALCSTTYAGPRKINVTNKCTEQQQFNVVNNIAVAHQHVGIDGKPIFRSTTGLPAICNKSVTPASQNVGESSAPTCANGKCSTGSTTRVLGILRR